MANDEGWFKPDAGTGGMALEGVIGLFVHVDKEMREAREAQVELATDSGGAIGISGDVAARGGGGF